MARQTLILKGPTYWSPGDEKAFFAWLRSISCVASVTGHLKDLHIQLKRPPGKGCRRELDALVRRYQMNAGSVAKQLGTPRGTT